MENAYSARHVPWRCSITSLTKVFFGSPKNVTHSDGALFTYWVHTATLLLLPKTLGNPAIDSVAENLAKQSAHDHKDINFHSWRGPRNGIHDIRGFHGDTSLQGGRQTGKAQCGHFLTEFVIP